MTIAISTALPEAGTLETAARFHLDSAREFLDGAGIGASDLLSDEPIARDFWHHMNAAWRLIQQVEGAGLAH